MSKEMKVSRRTEAEMDADMWIESKEYAKGKDYREIARIMNERGLRYDVSPASVKNDIERVMVEWKRENLDKMEARIVKEVMALEEMEREAMEGYEQSRGLTASDYSILMKRGFTKEEIDLLFDGTAPDPRFLQVRLNIQTQKMKFLGLDKGNDIAKNTVINYNLSGVDDDTLARIADKIQDSKLKEIVAEKGVDEQ